MSGGSAGSICVRDRRGSRGWLRGGLIGADRRCGGEKDDDSGGEGFHGRHFNPQPFSNGRRPTLVIVDCLPSCHRNETTTAPPCSRARWTCSILRTLLFGPAHGHGIAKHIQRTTDEVLKLEHGSLYPALHRLLERGWIIAKWETLPPVKRECRYYRLTPLGRKQLAPRSRAGTGSPRRSPR